MDGIDFDELIRRAEGQAEALERRRHAVAAYAPSREHAGTPGQLRLAASAG